MPHADPSKRDRRNRGFRSIVVDGVAYRWRASRHGNVVIRDPNGTSRYIRGSAAIGVSEETFERGQWKCTGDGAVTPANIAALIRGTPPLYDVPLVRSSHEAQR